MMNGPRRIGDTRLQAIDWVQDLLHSTRPEAGRTVASLMEANKLIETPYGMVLFEDDEDVERRRRSLLSKKSTQRNRGGKMFAPMLKAWAGPASDMILAHQARHPEQARPDQARLIDENERP